MKKIIRSPITQMGGMQKRIDWLSLKVEYMASAMSLRALKRKYKIGGDKWYYAKTNGWHIERQKLREESARKVIASNGEEYYKNIIPHYKELVLKIIDQQKAVLRKTEKDGEIVKPLKAVDIMFMAKAVAELDKLTRGLSDKPTETVEHKVTVDWLYAVAKYDEEQKAKAIPTTVIPTEAISTTAVTQGDGQSN